MNLSAGSTLTAQVTYLNDFQPSLTAPFAQFGGFAIRPALAFFLVAVVVLLAAFGWEHFSNGKHEGLTLALLMVVLVSGGVVFY